MSDQGPHCLRRSQFDSTRNARLTSYIISPPARSYSRLVLCAARYVFLQRTFKLWEARVGALGGARATLTRNNALARAVRVTGVSVFRTWQSLQRGGTLAALPHRAQSSVRVNAIWADVPHRNRDHRAYGAVRRVHSFFPYNVTDVRSSQLLRLCAPHPSYYNLFHRPRRRRVGHRRVMQADAHL